MKRLILFFLLLLPVFSYAQMKVYTVAGCDTASSEGDGRIATAAQINSTEGFWFDGVCNLYICDGYKKIRKINTNTGKISTVAGLNSKGYSGDNGPATNAQVSCYGLYSDVTGNVYFADPGANRVRKVDVGTGIITTFAGGGTSLGDGGPATNAQVDNPLNTYGDNAGNIYVAESTRIRKINSTGIITTIVGTGSLGLSGDGGGATNAQVNYPHGMLCDDRGNFYFADRANHRIRKIDSKGIITTYAGSSDGYSGDGGPATAAQLSGPISFVIDYSGGMVIGDNQNNYIRRVDPQTHIITTIGGVGTAHGSGSLVEGATVTVAEIHPEFMYLDRAGNIYFSCFCNKIRKVTGYLPGLAGNKNDCGETVVDDVIASDEVKLFPNPVTDVLHINTTNRMYQTLTITNSIGQTILQQNINATETAIPVSKLAADIYYISLRGSAGVAVKRFVKD